MLAQKIEDHNCKIQTQRLKMGGVNAACEADRSLQKQIKIYENRLDKAYIKYNEVCNLTPYPLFFKSSEQCETLAVPSKSI